MFCTAIGVKNSDNNSGVTAADSEQ